MKKIDVTSYMNIAIRISEFIKSFTSGQEKKPEYEVGFFKTDLENFYKSTDLTVSKTPIKNLLDNLTEYLNQYSVRAADLFKGKSSEENPPKVLERFNQGMKLHALKAGAEKIVTLLWSELPTKPTYVITSKLAYKIEDLIDVGENIFPQETIILFSKDSINEIRAGLRCFAFELATATAFHLIRATETFIREYYQLIIGSLPKPKQRDWGAYTRNLRQHNVKTTDGGIKASEKILGTIDHIREHYRNPVIHPEETLTMEEAGSLVGLLQSAISILVHENEILKKGKKRAGS